MNHSKHNNSKDPRGAMSVKFSFQHFDRLFPDPHGGLPLILNAPTKENSGRTFPTGAVIHVKLMKAWHFVKVSVDCSAQLR